ncbi:MAG TPA: crossover junction endodeoxyribonuclease RuvC [Gammaproteobacteria bacterium]|nr:crossover junction endodeoxyribonuclease RuvC [Gammaproteobacteria bacterium]
MNGTVRILGIDPGSRVTGYGFIEQRGGRVAHLLSGCIRAEGDDLPQRLGSIFTALDELVAAYQPHQVAVERVFVQRNVDSALKLGQARGAAICAVVRHGLPVHEYTPAEIKKALVGRGAAAKEQVQHMVKTLLGHPRPLSADAADALACALCHNNIRQTLAHLPGVSGRRAGRWR